jgi:hypothetical protein
MSSSVRGRGTTDKPHTVEKLECGELRIVVCRGTLTQTLALGRAYPWVCARFRVLTLACAYACVCVPIATWVCLPIFSLYASPYPQWLVLSLCLVCWMPPRGGGGGGLGGSRMVAAQWLGGPGPDGRRGIPRSRSSSAASSI